VARSSNGPRQPLSQRRPKVASTRAAGGAASSSPVAKKAAKGAAGAPGAKLPAAKRSRPRSSGAGRAAPAADALYDGLLALYPDAHCELDFRNAFELLAATILSAQCTDKRVNMVTPALFAAYPTPAALAAAKQEDVEGIIRSTGFFRSKAKSLIGMAGALVDRHGGEVPRDMDALTKLPGVGRKTANVILGNAFHTNEGVVVDTHVARLSERLGLSRQTDPVKIEQELMRAFPRERWTMLSHLLIWHGRRVCEARKPRCGECALRAMCPSRQDA
jgi:endonuclease-3